MNRPDNVPPSQGGRYTGFGSTYDPPTSDNPLEDPLASLQKGWSMFSSIALQGAKLAVSGAETLGKTVTETVIKPTTTAIRDPNFNNNVTAYVSNLQQKVTEVGSKGLQVATEVGTKGFAIATEAATKGIDLASTVTKSTLAQVNQYTPVSPNQAGWEKITPTGKTPDLEWDEWGSPKATEIPTLAVQPATDPALVQSSPKSPLEAPLQQKAAQKDEWEDW
jgi:ADP-ribosylation factor GTPase-activating protein 1